MSRPLLAAVLFAAASCGPSPRTDRPQARSPKPEAPPPRLPPLAGGVELIVTPDPHGHPAFVQASAAAQHTLRLAMFHLTDPAVISELAEARARGVDVRVLLDGASKLNDRALRELRDAGVAAKPSSRAFSLTHEKLLVADDATALVTAINLTMTAAKTRDLGLVVHDRAVIAELTAVFDADWANADAGTGTTPPVSEPHLVWSPVDSRAKLAELAASARTSLLATVENLGDPEIQRALLAAAHAGATVRLIVPACDKNPDPTFNYRYLYELQAGGVQTRVMPEPSSARTPYMHSKMLLADGARAYVGSVNFSTNSTQKAREVGLLFAEPAALAQIAEIFEQDWQTAVATPAAPPTDCRPSD